MRFVATASLMVLLTGCAEEPIGPPCTFTTLDSAIVWTGSPDCTLRGEGIPPPWYDLDGCEIRYVLPADMDCDAVGGREVGMVEGRLRCVIPRLEVVDRTPGADPPSGQGWFFDDFTDDMPCPGAPSPDTFRFLPEPPVGTQVSVSCLTPVAPESGAYAYCRADPCEGDLVCDPLRERCLAPCTSDDDCEAAGFEGWICDTRPISEIDPRETDDSPSNHCINPTCQVE